MSEPRKPVPALLLLSPSERARAASIAPREIALLVFTVGGVRHGVELHRAREILRSRKATPLPVVPSFVLGVIAIRGEIAPVIDVARRLGVVDTCDPSRARLVVVSSVSGEPVALRVEDVLGVLRIRPEQVREPPAEAPLLRAVHEDLEVTLVLDIDAVLDFRTTPLR